MPRHSGAATFGSAIVLLVASGYYIYTLGLQSPSRAHYLLHGVFYSTSGLKVGEDVTIGGVPVGSISAIALDPGSFTATVTFSVGQIFQLPKDTTLSVGSSGFTAANSLVVVPGHSRDYLSEGATIRDTHEMRSLEQSVSQYIFGARGLGN